MMNRSQAVSGKLSISAPQSRIPSAGRMCRRSSRKNATRSGHCSHHGSSDQPWRTWASTACIVQTSALIGQSTATSDGTGDGKGPTPARAFGPISGHGTMVLISSATASTASAIPQPPGTRNGRGRPGSVLRSRITPAQTMMNANSVPIEQSSATTPIGSRAAPTQTTLPVRIVVT